MTSFERIISRIRNDEFSIVVVVLLVITACVCGRYDTPRKVLGSKTRWPTDVSSYELDLAKCLRSEADMNNADWEAIAWVLVKQWRWKPVGYPFARKIRAYCAVFKNGRWRPTERPGKILTSTWGEPKFGTVEEWATIRDFISRWHAGLIPDPCPECVGWGGPAVDTIPDDWICPLGPPVTANLFCYSNLSRRKK